MIVLRDCISDGTGTIAKGIIMPWPQDMDLPPGMVWLRVRIFAGGDEPRWGDFTDAAKQIMREVLQ